MSSVSLVHRLPQALSYLFADTGGHQRIVGAIPKLCHGSKLLLGERKEVSETRCGLQRAFA